MSTFTVDQVRVNLFKTIPIFSTVDSIRLAVTDCIIVLALKKVNDDYFGECYLEALTFLSAYMIDLLPGSPNSPGGATSGLINMKKESDLSVRFANVSGVADGSHAQNSFGVLFDFLVESGTGATLLC